MGYTTYRDKVVGDNVFQSAASEAKRNPSNIRRKPVVNTSCNIGMVRPAHVGGGVFVVQYCICFFYLKAKLLFLRKILMLLFPNYLMMNI
jgi:hypothetical protein